MVSTPLADAGFGHLNLKMATDKSKQKRKRGKSWENEETDALISVWSEENVIAQISHKTTSKKAVWAEMAVRLEDIGFAPRTWEQVKSKVHDLTKAYKDI